MCPDPPHADACVHWAPPLSLPQTWGCSLPMELSEVQGPRVQKERREGQELGAQGGGRGRRGPHGHRYPCIPPSLSFLLSLLLSFLPSLLPSPSFPPSFPPPSSPPFLPLPLSLLLSLHPSLPLLLSLFLGIKRQHSSKLCLTWSPAGRSLKWDFLPPLSGHPRTPPPHPPELGQAVPRPSFSIS